jgi:hypothetical protein
MKLIFKNILASIFILFTVFVFSRICFHVFGLLIQNFEDSFLFERYFENFLTPLVILGHIIPSYFSCLLICSLNFEKSFNIILSLPVLWAALTTCLTLYLFIIDLRNLQEAFTTIFGALVVPFTIQTALKMKHKKTYP